MATHLNALPPWLSLDERKAERWPTNVPALLQTRIHPVVIDVRVVDLSALGCLLTIPADMATGRCVTLTLPHAIIVDGWIAWSKSRHAGLDFAHPLPLAVVEQMLVACDVASQRTS